jgi:hypothetical protein
MLIHPVLLLLVLWLHMLVVLQLPVLQVLCLLMLVIWQLQVKSVVRKVARPSGNAPLAIRRSPHLSRKQIPPPS